MNLVEILCRLQTLDQEWEEKGRRFQAVRQELADQTPLEGRREAQRQREAQLASRRRELRDAELELAGLQAKAREIETNLYSGRIRSPKELENLRRDGEQIKQRIAHLEDRILLAMTEVDELEAASQRGAEELRAFEGQWAESREALTQEHKALRTRLQELQAERDKTRALLDRNVLALYDALRAQKGGQALAPLRDGLCQVCRVALPSFKIQSVETGETIITCEGCGRILYRG